MTLAGRRIALTRPEPGALGDRLTTLGAQVVHVPLIAIDDPADGGAALRRALARLRSFDWLVVTSANGARRAGPAAQSRAHGPVGGSRPGDRRRVGGRGRTARRSRARRRAGGGSAGRVPRRRHRGCSSPRPTEPVGRSPTASVRRATPSRSSSPTARSSERRAPTRATRWPRSTPSCCRAAPPHPPTPSSVGTAARPLIVTIGPVTAGAARRCGLTVAEVAPSPDPDTLVRILASTL